MRSIAPALLLFALSGCAAAPVLTMASFTLNGASYVATGKSVTDHALSAATDRECDFWRAFREKPFSPICRRNAPPDVAPADASSPDEAAEALAAIAPAAGSDVVPGAVAPELTADPAPGSASPPTALAEIHAALAAAAEEAASAAFTANLAAAPEAVAAIDRARTSAAGAALAEAVVVSIARDPTAVAAIVSAAVEAAPAHRATIVAEASVAFPGFADDIARAAVDRAPISPPPPAAAVAHASPIRVRTGSPFAPTRIARAAPRAIRKGLLGPGRYSSLSAAHP